MKCVDCAYRYLDLDAGYAVNMNNYICANGNLFMPPPLDISAERECQYFKKEMGESVDEYLSRISEEERRKIINEIEKYYGDDAEYAISCLKRMDAGMLFL